MTEQFYANIVRTKTLEYYRSNIGTYPTKPYIANVVPKLFAENSNIESFARSVINGMDEKTFCVHSLSTGTVVNLCYEVVPESTQSPGGLTTDNVPGCTSLIDNTTIGCRAAFSITCNGALKVSEAAYYIYSGGLGDECVIAGRRDMGASSASSTVQEGLNTPNEVKHTVLNRNMAIEQFMEQAARSGLEREGFVELIKREGIEFNGGNYTLASSPETFAWFLKILDKIKDWPEPKQASIVVPAPGDINASQTEEPTTPPEQETSSEQGTDISLQPTETVNPVDTGTPSTPEQDKPFEPTVENTPNTTNSEPKDTEEPRATGPEQGVPETQPTDAITEEPRGPEPDPSIITRPQRTNSSDPEEGKQVEPKSTQAPTIGLGAQSGKEDDSDAQSKLMGHNQINALDYIIPTVTILIVGGLTFCYATKGWCSGLFSGLFKRGTGNKEQGTLAKLDFTDSQNHVSLSVSPTPDSTPTVGKNTKPWHPLRLLEPLQSASASDSSTPDSPKDGFKLTPQAYVGNYNTDPLQTQEISGSLSDLGTEAMEILE